MSFTVHYTVIMKLSNETQHSVHPSFLCWIRCSKGACRSNAANSHISRHKLLQKSFELLSIIQWLDISCEILSKKSKWEKLTNIKCKNVHVINITQNFNSVLSEEPEIQFAKWLWFRPCANRQQPPQQPLAGQICAWNIAVFSLYFLTALQGKGCCGALHGGGPVASTSPQNPGDSWPQYGPYSASTKLITSVPVPALKKT